MNASVPFLIYMPNLWEALIILVVALLIFGRRLPEVARSLGRGIVEFKKGLKGVEDDAERASDAPSQVAPSSKPAPKQLAAPAEPTVPASPEPAKSAEKA